MPTEFIAASQEKFNKYYFGLAAERKHTMQASKIFAKLPLNRFAKYVRLLLESRSRPEKNILVHLDHEGFADPTKYTELVKQIPKERLLVL